MRYPVYRLGFAAYYLLYQLVVVAVLLSIAQGERSFGGTERPSKVVNPRLGLYPSKIRAWIAAYSWIHLGLVVGLWLWYSVPD